MRRRLAERALGGTVSVTVLDPEPRAPGTSFTTNSWSQTAFYTSTAPEVLLSGHLGSGKTRPLVEKADLRARNHGRARVAVCRRYRVDLGLTTLKKFLDECVTAGERAFGWHSAAEGGSTMFYPNGSEIVFAGLDNPGKVLSAEFDLVLFDEAQEADEFAWDTLAGRLRWRPEPAEDGSAAFRQLAGACNPGAPTHFLFKRFRPDQGSHRVRSELPVKLRDGRVVPAGRVVRECILAGELDNAENLDDDYLYRLQQYRGRFRDRYVLGRWVLFEGVVYGEVWDPSQHVVARPRAWDQWGGYPPPTWPRYRTFDFGFNNPFVCSWYARDDDDVLWRYREIYYSHRTVPEHKAQVAELEARELAALRAGVEALDLPPRELNAQRPERLAFRLSVADHDAGDRAILERGSPKIVTRPAHKDVDSGVQAVYDLLAARKLRFVSGARVERDPVLEAEGDPTCTEEEMPLLRYPKERDTVLGRGKREGPVKEKDHGHDALHYLLNTIRHAVRIEVVR